VAAVRVLRYMAIIMPPSFSLFSGQPLTLLSDPLQVTFHDSQLRVLLCELGLEFRDFLLEFCGLVVGFVGLALACLELALAYLDIVLAYLDLVLAYLDLVLACLDLALACLDTFLPCNDIAAPLVGGAVVFVTIRAVRTGRLRLL
jgi:hypothetical protein